MPNMSSDKQTESLFSGVKLAPFNALFKGAIGATSTLFSNLKNSSPASTRFDAEKTRVPESIQSGEEYAPPCGRTPAPVVMCADQPTHWPSVKLTRLPAGLNRKSMLQSHFERFGTICRIVCQPSLDSAYVAFDSVAAAHKAKHYGLESNSETSNLPSTVLITMAQCRTRIPSTSLSRNASNDAGHPQQQLEGDQESSTKSALSSLEPTTFREVYSGPQMDSPQGLFSTANDSVKYNSYRASDFNPQSLFGARSAVKSTQQSRTPVFVDQRPTEAISTQSEIVATSITDIVVPATIPINSDQRVSALQSHYQLLRGKERSSSYSVGSGSGTAGAITHSDYFPADLLGAGADEDQDVVATAIKGTCPDMCPELERYLREAHHRVSLFECFTNGSTRMDYTRAVKDYQRSSADQPVPLPCELRPTAVLQRTMLYLLASIADRPEIETAPGQRSLWKPWYEFMWTRTRAIRKDIAQQRLCCPVVVGVVERIARFHIFCAARLIDQPIDSFDPRINSENLTQCLQTLKEMYNDLATRAVCPCEPEFRAYMLLMRLNDQGALNEVQKLPERLIRSEEVRFAVRVHEAVTTNNYIRFFRYVRCTSLLNACLLHRYFVQLRGQALIRFSAAFFGQPRREVQYPLETLTNQLGFEDRTAARTFCECWGLAVSTVEDCVVFERTIYPQPPEVPWRAGRSFRLIEQKRAGIALSTLLNKDPVKPEDVQPHPVQSSFDLSGRFVGQMKADPFAVASTATCAILHQITPPADGTQAVPCQSVTLAAAASQRIKESPGRPQSTINDQLVSNDFLTGLLEPWLCDWIDCPSLARECLAEEQIIRQLAGALTDQSVYTELFLLAREVLTDTHQTLKNQLSVTLHDQFLESVVCEEIRCISQHELVAGTICVDILDHDLLTSELFQLARNCWLSAAADAQLRHSQLRRCLARLRKVLYRRQLLQRERFMLERCLPPASPNLHPLTLVGSRAKQCLAELQRSSPEQSLAGVVSSGRCKRPRFSLWASEIDRRLTWEPIEMKPYTTLQPFALTLCSSILRTPHMPASVTEQFSDAVLTWLQCKLIHFHSEVTLTPRQHALSSPVNTLICIGGTQHPDANNPSAQHILTVCPHELDVKDMTVSIGLTNYHRLCFPPDPDGVYRPTPTWSTLLRTKLDTLVATGQKTDNIPTMVTQPGPMETEDCGIKVTGEQLLWHYFDRHFFHPMARLARQWKARCLVNPSPGAIFSAYQLVVDELLLHLSSEIDLLHGMVTLPSTVQTVLCQFTASNNAPTTETVLTWSDLRLSWSDLADQLRISSTSWQASEAALNRIERGFVQAVAMPAGRHGPPATLLAPWLTLCLTVIRSHLGSSTGLLMSSSSYEKVSTGASKLSQSVVDQLVALLEIPDDDHFRDDAASPSSLIDLAAHFALLREPSLTQLDAIRLSMQASRQRHILTASAGKRVHDDNRPVIGRRAVSSLQIKLNKLDDRLNCLEISMHSVLEETPDSPAYCSSPGGSFIG